MAEAAMSVCTLQVIMLIILLLLLYFTLKVHNYFQLYKHKHSKGLLPIPLYLSLTILKR